MCGIAGFLDDERSVNADIGQALLRRMTNAIAHRGPDGDGSYVEPECGLGLGHRRLSIIDLSSAGSQPMTSANGRWVITYNGEIYNFEEMRRGLDRHQVRWVGTSDTEVLLEAIAHFGFEEAIKLTNGMFALAAWDRQERALYLARDRLGEKPLYFGWQRSCFLFASELKAIAAHPAFRPVINPGSVASYLTYGYVPQPHSIYANISQLEPGRFLKLKLGAGPAAPLETVPYWTFPTPQPRPMKEEDAVAELDVLLRDAIRIRMRADVPMGAFLSGGIDSSTIVALMQAQSQSRIRSYSIGFHEDAYDESRYAREVAAHIGTEHTEMHVTADDALNVIPQLPQLYDEPFADPSEVPTFLLSKLTRQHVTVSLSGDGGDELFGGYGRYFDFERRWQKRFAALDLFRPLVAGTLNAIPESVLRAIYVVVPTGLRKNVRPRRFKRIAAGLGRRTEHEFYRFMMEQWSPNMLRRPPDHEVPVFFDRHDIARFCDPFSGMMFLDSGSYLPDDILVKVDRAAMAVSLESRVPLLDHRIVEFASYLPLDLKRRGDAGKWLLRRVLDRYVPRHLIDRPKQGFGPPVKEWLRGPLKEWGADLLNDSSTAIGALVDLETVRGVWNEHQEGEFDQSYALWNILMLVAWAREWRPVLN
ncbi:MAG TPA: asparagine synthase (glutamine-hydrolyzing) [Rhizomicrobium sp.]|nr:asparagine synthase (glutamine-hydrolyzing) [Rhizomicrobium sp.]